MTIIYVGTTHTDARRRRIDILWCIRQPPLHSLAVQVVIFVVGEVGIAAAAGGTAAAALSAGLVGEAEIGAEAAGLLERLAEHLVLLDVVVRHRPEESSDAELKATWQKRSINDPSLLSLPKEMYTKRRTIYRPIY